MRGRHSRLWVGHIGGSNAVVRKSPRGHSHGLGTSGSSPGTRSGSSGTTRRCSPQPSMSTLDDWIAGSESIIGAAVPHPIPQRNAGVARRQHDVGGLSGFRYERPVGHVGGGWVGGQHGRDAMCGHDRRRPGDDLGVPPCTTSAFHVWAAARTPSSSVTTAAVARSGAMHQTKCAEWCRGNRANQPAGYRYRRW